MPLIRAWETGRKRKRRVLYYTHRWRIALKADYLVHTIIICLRIIRVSNNPSPFHTSLNGIITEAKLLLSSSYCLAGWIIGPLYTTRMRWMRRGRGWMAEMEQMRPRWPGRGKGFAFNWCLDFSLAPMF